MFFILALYDVFFFFKSIYYYRTVQLYIKAHIEIENFNLFMQISSIQTSEDAYSSSQKKKNKKKNSVIFKRVEKTIFCLCGRYLFLNALLYFYDTELYAVYLFGTINGYNIMCNEILSRFAKQKYINTHIL